MRISDWSSDVCSSDLYVTRAKAEGYRSRAAYKLIELDERFGLVRGARRVVDLGIAPGGWSQVVRKLAPGAAVVGVELLPTEPLEGGNLLQREFMDEAAQHGGATRRRRVGEDGKRRG